MHITFTTVVVITTHTFQERIITTLGTATSNFSSCQDTLRHPSNPFDGETVTRTKLSDTQLSALTNGSARCEDRPHSDGHTDTPNGDVEIHRHFIPLHLALDYDILTDAWVAYAS